jgi:hypothetical protein
LNTPVLVGVVLLFLLEIYMLWGRPQLSGYLGQQVSVQLIPPVSVEVDPAASGQVQERIQEAQRALPTAIAAVPAGEFYIPETEANAFFAANQAALDPIESLSVDFMPGQVQADMHIYGTRVQLTSGMVARDGRLELVDPRIDGALGYLFDVDEIVSPLETQINNQLLSQRQLVREARVEQDQLVLIIEEI